jgi:hypothetical protein
MHACLHGIPYNPFSVSGGPSAKVLLQSFLRRSIHCVHAVLLHDMFRVYFSFGDQHDHDPIGKKKDIMNNEITTKIKKYIIKSLINKKPHF